METEEREKSRTEREENRESESDSCKTRAHCRGLCCDRDNLYSMMRACGRHLYHCSRASGQGKILAILSERERMTQKELQEILQIQSGSISEILTKLEEKGLIRRNRDAEDKRRSVLELTDAGREWTLKYAVQRDEESFFCVLEADERETLKGLLKKLLEDWRREEESVETRTGETGAK